MEESSLDLAKKWVVNKFAMLTTGSMVAFAICLVIGLFTENLLYIITSGVLILLLLSLIFATYKIDYFYA